MSTNTYNVEKNMRHDWKYIFIVGSVAKLKGANIKRKFLISR